jgi:uncharacterized protein (DUF362 family)/Pyruvate/2-oxoacid:ferredoxin oxidoreductase delta subunit
MTEKRRKKPCSQEKECEVYVHKCNDYKEVKKTLSHLFDKAQVNKKFCTGERVLLKPNILHGASPDQAVTTHPLFLSAVFELFLDMGVRLVLGDSPISGNFQKEAKLSGITDVCKKYNVEISTFDVSVEKKLSADSPRSYYIAKKLEEVDSVVNLPKLKTHSLMTLTLAVKNTFGCIVGREKQKWHVKAVSNERFANMLIDLHQLISPKLNILDGVTGMRGDGPSSGEPFSSGLVALSDNGFALDDYVCKIWGIDKTKVLTVHLANKRGITPSYEVIGDFEPDEVLTLPKSSYGKALDFLGFFARIFYKVPYIDDERCIECLECEKSCPKEAIDVDEKYIDYSKCIRCYVCHEVCPNKAIRLKRRFFPF